MLYLLQIEEIKKLLNGKPCLERVDFHNWADTQICIGVCECHPKNLKEIKALVVACDLNRMHIRCAGAGHSWAPIFSDDGTVLVIMDKMESYPSGGKVKYSVCI